MRNKFNRIIRSIRSHLGEASAHPELVNLKVVADEVNQLTKQFKKLERTRLKATKYFSTKTRLMDTYISDRRAEYVEVKQEVSTALPEVQRLLPTTPLGPPKLVTCTKCASAPMTPRELENHDRLNHWSEVEESLTSLKLNQPKHPEIKRREQFSVGTYRQKSPSISSSSESDSDSSHKSVTSRPSRKKKHSPGQPQPELPRQVPIQQDQMTQLVQIMAKSNFRMEDICGKFNPAKYSTLDILPHYKNFRTELNDLEKAMKELNFSKTEMYKKLKSRLEGAAKTLVSEDHPDQGSYARAIKKLDETYWTQDLHVQNLVHKLRSLPKMDNTNADKVNAFATEALSLMNQLENLIGLDARSAQQWCFITFSTILVKKFNTEASKMWDKMNDADEDEGHPLGHTLTINDLKRVILKTKKKLRRREFNKAFNEDSSLKSDKEKKKKEEEARKAKEEAERRKKESAMQEAYSFQTQTGSGSKTKAPK